MLGKSIKSHSGSEVWCSNAPLWASTNIFGHFFLRLFFVTSALLLVLTHFGPSWISFKSFLVPPSGLLDLYFIFLAFSNDFHNFHDFIMFSVKSGPPIATTLCSQHKYCIFAWYCCKKTKCMESWSKVIQEAKFKAQTTFHSFFWSLLHLCLF